MAAKYRDMIEAFTIFAKYEGDEQYLAAAEHDEIWAGPSPEDVSDEDKKRLEELGWTEWDTGNFHLFV